MAYKKKQIVITIGREYGSLGHKIADMLGEELGLPVVDKALLFKMAENHGFKPEVIKKYDERPRNVLTSAKRKGFSNSMEDILAEMIFKYEKDLAETGESFIMVGRCGETMLKDCPGLIRVFITADDNERVEHIAKAQNLDPKAAKSLMNKMDKNRKNYHNHYSDFEWGDIKSYDLVISSSELGIDGCVDLIKKYVSLWKKKSPNWDEE